ncbi:MAG: PIN domain-containing protein, partial [Acidobacteriota bacterium]|nr:PIN domain-containing protein [Acidobacteriota bacterium]
MIALDTNVLVRYLVDDDPEQAETARALLASVTPTRPGFVCREVMVELVWVLRRT